VASVRPRPRADGTTAYVVLFRHDGRQTTVTFDTEKAAEAFRAAVDAHGPARALDMHDIEPPRPRATSPAAVLTVEQWVRSHIDGLTGVERYTVHKYDEFLRNDITPRFGDLPLDKLDKAALADWVKHMQTHGGRKGEGHAAKTLINKFRFLAGALNAAVAAGKIPTNPATGIRLPRGNAGGGDHDMRMLTTAEFKALLAAADERHQLMLEFMVASGMRWGEVSALEPRHVDIKAATVHVRQAWKYSPDGGYPLGPPKTRRSRRTVDVPARILKRLDLTGEFVFLNEFGNPVRYPRFLRDVWNPAVLEAKLDPRPTPHDLRHTYASWQLAGGTPITVVSRQLGHESISITVDTYGDVDRTTSKVAATVMDQLLAD
jgi:integrase